MPSIGVGNRPATGSVKPGSVGSAVKLSLGHFMQMMKIFNRGQLFCLSGLGSKKIPPNLKVQPKICENARKFCQSKRRAWSDAALLINELMYSLIRTVNGIRQITLTDIHGHEELVPKHFPGMSRRPVRWNATRGAGLVRRVCQARVG